MCKSTDKLKTIIQCKDHFSVHHGEGTQAYLDVFQTDLLRINQQRMQTQYKERFYLGKRFI